VCSNGVLCVLNTKINHGRTRLCNISIFGSILLPVHSEVEWMWFWGENCVCVLEMCPLCAEQSSDGVEMVGVLGNDVLTQI
jgi:hypothetical protein